MPLRGDERANREAIRQLPDGTLVHVWFDGDTEPRVLVVRGADLFGARALPGTTQFHYASQWNNGHAMWFHRHEVIWTPPTNRRQQLIDLLDGIPIEPEWLIDLLGERGLTITEATP